MTAASETVAQSTIGRPYFSVVVEGLGSYTVHGTKPELFQFQRSTAMRAGASPMKQQLQEASVAKQAHTIEIIIDFQTQRYEQQCTYMVSHPLNTVVNKRFLCPIGDMPESTTQVRVRSVFSTIHGQPFATQLEETPIVFPPSTHELLSERTFPMRNLLNNGNKQLIVNVAPTDAAGITIAPEPVASCVLIG